MAIFSKLLLSNSVSGQQIIVNATGATGTPLHTSTVAGLDEIWLYATNNNTGVANLTILWGGSGSGNLTQQPIYPQNGRQVIFDGALLQGGLNVSAFSNVSGSINIDGYINRII